MARRGVAVAPLGEAPLSPKQDLLYRVERSARRRKTVAVRVERDGEVVVLAPLRMPNAAIRDFLRERASWIARQRARLAAVPPPTSILERSAILFRGATLPVTFVATPNARCRVAIDGVGLEVTVPAAAADPDDIVRRALERWYASEALVLATDAIRRFASALGAAPAQVLIRNQQSRWGSCAADGSIRLNWRIAMLQPALCDYVVVHELAHLLQRNHSTAFWNVVAGILPSHQELRSELRRAEPLTAPW